MAFRYGPMQLYPREIPDWPKLAWVATFNEGSLNIQVLHGPCVETCDAWCVEAVWAGPFADGDFDRTDLVFGTGIRHRQTHVAFVSSGTTLDRLWYFRNAAGWQVSNSLPALLAFGRNGLLESYRRYPQDLGSIANGLGRYAKELPLENGTAWVTYFHNLVFDGSSLIEVEKPQSASAFKDFDAYYTFLKDTADKLGTNLRAQGRKCKIQPLATISSGYDSATGAAIARGAGCTKVVSFRRARAFIKARSDSGKDVAVALGMSCEEYDRTAREYPDEEAVWAALGLPDDLNLTLFRYPGPLTLLFSGFYGSVWDRQPHHGATSIVRTDPFGTGFTELRLHRGVFHCAVPFWGVRCHADIHAISKAPEMAPWTLGTNYDRPIPRRIIETAGIKRGTFARRKSATTYRETLCWPLSPSAQESFGRFLQLRGIQSPNAWRLLLLKVFHRLNVNIVSRLPKRFPAWFRAYVQRQPEGSFLITHWAHSLLVGRYSTVTLGRIRAIEARSSKGWDSESFRL
jgi:hypothetical protein